MVGKRGIICFRGFLCVDYCIVLWIMVVFYVNRSEWFIGLVNVDVYVVVWGGIFKFVIRVGLGIEKGLMDVCLYLLVL